MEDIVEPPAVDANDDGTVAEDLDDPDYKPVDTDVEDGWEDDAMAGLAPARVEAYEDLMRGTKPEYAPSGE